MNEKIDNTIGLIIEDEDGYNFAIFPEDEERDELFYDLDDEKYVGLSAKEKIILKVIGHPEPLTKEEVKKLYGAMDEQDRTIFYYSYGYNLDIIEDEVDSSEDMKYVSEVDCENAEPIKKLLSNHLEPELVCLTLSLITCSLRLYGNINEDFMIPYLKDMFRGMYKLDDTRYSPEWEDARISVLLDEVTELVQNLRFMSLPVDTQEYCMNEQFTYMLFSMIFANKVFYPY